MGRRRTLGLTLALCLVSCTADDATPPTTTPPDTTITTAARPVDPGRLAVVDSSGNIVVTAPDGSDGQIITEGGGETAAFTQPVWSPDGARLAWGQAGGEGFAVAIGEPGSDETATIATPNLPFYMNWSPDGANLGILHNGTTGVAFQIVDVADGEMAPIDEDAPFYFSWSPQGDRLVTHAGANRAETITPNGDRESLEPTAATYLAPQWTDAGVFHIVDDELIIEEDEGVRRPIVAVSGLTLFVANQSGTRVALQSGGDGDAPITASTEELPMATTRAVVVVDVETGDTDVVHDSLALGFFWAPDGESLLILTVDEGQVLPYVWTDGDAAQYTPYRPVRNMLEDTFPFFPQYAQSVSFWSPDSSAFAYAGQVGGESGVWVQALAEEDPVRVSDGIWVAWSPSRG